jgi:maltose-binding protein MalE
VFVVFVRRRLVRIGQIGIPLIFLASLLLVGCRLGAEPDTAVELTWWVTYARESAEYAAFAAVADAYSAQTRDVVIDVVPVPWDDIAPQGTGTSKLALAQQAGDGPDLWGPVPHNWTGSFAQTGQALALETTQIQDVNQYAEVALQACRFNGKLFGVPILMDSLALIYSKDLVPDPPTSFAELIQLEHELVSADEDRWGLVLPLLSQYHVYPFIDAYGGYIFRCDDQGCSLDDIGLNSEGALRGTQFLSDLYLKEKLLPEPLVDRAVMNSHALHLFTEGRAAMLIEGSWVLPEIRASGIDYGVASIPTLPDTTSAPRSLTLVQALFVSAYSAHPAQALDLLNYIADTASVIALQSALGKTPVRQDVLRSQPFAGNREIRAWHSQASGGVPLPNVPELGYVWVPWGQALDEAIPGLTPTQEALDRAVTQIKGYLQGNETD